MPSNNYPGIISRREQSTATLVVGGTLFALSFWYAVRKIRNQHDDQRRHGQNRKQQQVRRQRSFNASSQAATVGRGRSRGGRERFSVLYKDRDTRSSIAQIGSRGQAALSTPTPYHTQFLKCLSNLCDPVSNPQGYIPLCVAENRLVVDLLIDRFVRIAPTSASAAFSDRDVYWYNSFLGLPIARQAASYFLARRFLHPNSPDLSPDQASRQINPKHVALGSGAASILNSLFFLLGEEGDACLIPAPYYAAFENDMSVIAGIIPFSIDQTDPVAGPTEAELSAAYAAARAEGLNPKFILITNPNNPLGTIYSRDVMLRTIQWARNNNMHTIVDEIYALSVHRMYGQSFESVIRILDNNLGDDVHMLWAVSKDFGASGFRVGIVYSQNEAFMEGLSSLNIFSGVSGPMQYLISELLTDDQFIDTFLAESRKRLLVSYHICTAKLQEMVVPFVPAEAGMFVYVDLSSLLPEKTFEGEERLSNLMFDYARMVLTPGESQRDAKPGMFRICYAWVTVDNLMIAMERLSRLVAKIRRMDWDDLNERGLSGVL